jgi:adenosyl cobinamide kinase/adenosyl cobinamide phosphate guanylyltransferase
LDKQSLKNILYGSIYELSQDKNLYYRSTFGGKYSHFTPEGERVIVEILTMWVDKMLDEETKSLDERAKNLVLTQLKNQTKE